jgi:hypothetical protein
MCYQGALTEIDELVDSVRGRRLAVRHTSFNKLALVHIILKVAMLEAGNFYYASQT